MAGAAVEGADIGEEDHGHQGPDLQRASHVVGVLSGEQPSPQCEPEQRHPGDGIVHQLPLAQVGEALRFKWQDLFRS